MICGVASSVTWAKITGLWRSLTRMSSADRLAVSTATPVRAAVATTVWPRS